MAASQSHSKYEEEVRLGKFLNSCTAATDPQSTTGSYRLPYPTTAADEECAVACSQCESKAAWQKKKKDVQRAKQKHKGVLVSKDLDLQSWSLPGWIHEGRRRGLPWILCECWIGQSRYGTPWFGSALCRLYRGPMKKISSYSALLKGYNSFYIETCLFVQYSTQISCIKYLHGFVQTVSKVRRPVLHTAHWKKGDQRAEPPINNWKQFLFKTVFYLWHKKPASHLLTFPS